jgi:hypothetical protein
LDIWKHMLWPKEGPGVELTIWLPTTKSQESTRFPCVQVACNILLESSQWGLQIFFRPHLHRRSTRKIMVHQIAKVPTLAILGLPLGSPGTKSHLDVGPVGSHRIYYKGEGGGFPQVRAVVSFACLSCPWLALTPKVLKLSLSTWCWFCVGPCE